jgi:hypothetical protein
VKFTITMNMPSGRPDNNGEHRPVHQMICDAPVQSLAEFHENIMETDFIRCRLIYTKMDARGSQYFIDRGDIVLNTMWIGKVSEFIEKEEKHES